MEKLATHTRSISVCRKCARFIRGIAPAPADSLPAWNGRFRRRRFRSAKNLAKEIKIAGGACCCNFIARPICSIAKSVEGKQPEWVARWLDLGKPRELIELQRSAAFKNDVPRVHPPRTFCSRKTGFSITELDSVPGGHRG